MTRAAGADGLEVSGYVQPQLVFDQSSEDALDPDGTPLNQDRFLVRRARLLLDRSWEYVFVGVEVDANTVRGPRVSLAGAEVGATLPNDRGGLPYVRFAFGMFDVPFGFELAQSIRERPFTERTFGSRAYFPADSDVGIAVAVALGPVRATVAAVDGVPLGPDGDPTVYARQKTGVGRAGFDTAGDRRVAARGGLSLLKGAGFHEGALATKSSLQWIDTNQDGSVAQSELFGVVGQSSTASETFERWAVGADLGVTVESPLGTTRIAGEAIVAANLDRGYFVADPVSTGYTLRELTWYGYVLQDLTEHGLAGVRVDRYQPTFDLQDYRRGKYLPADASVLTVSPVVGVRLPDQASLNLQYDYVVDLLAIDGRGEPVDLPNDRWTLTGQVEFR